MQSLVQSSPKGMLKGFDISKYSGQKIDFPKFVADGFSFVISRASIGLSVDPSFTRHVKDARSAGLIVGSYHGFVDVDDIDTQAHLYHKINEDNGVTCDGLLPMNDYEIVHAQSIDFSVEAAYAFQLEIEGLWNVRQGESFVYTYPFFFDMIHPSPAKTGLGMRKLAIAHYGVQKPRVPKPWAEWTLWQHAGNSFVHGTLVDLDLFNGSKEDLPLVRERESVA